MQVCSNMTIFDLFFIYIGYILLRTIYRYSYFYIKYRENNLKIYKKRAELDRIFGTDTIVSSTMDDENHNISKELQKKIIRMDMCELLELLDTKKVTSVSLTKFLHNRSKMVGRKLEAVVDSFYDMALGLAREADILRASGDYKKEEKPFLGIPISIKESLGICGRDTTAGFASRLGDKSTADEECEIFGM